MLYFSFVSNIYIYIYIHIIVAAETVCWCDYSVWIRPPRPHGTRRPAVPQIGVNKYVCLKQFNGFSAVVVCEMVVKSPYGIRLEASWRLFGSKETIRASILWYSMCVKNRGVRLSRIRDFQQYNFNSIPTERADPWQQVNDDTSCTFAEVARLVPSRPRLWSRSWGASEWLYEEFARLARD